MKKIVDKYQKLEEMRIFSYTVRESIELLTPWLQISSLHNYKTIHFYCLKPLNFWHFVMATLGNEYNIFS